MEDEDQSNMERSPHGHLKHLDARSSGSSWTQILCHLITLRKDLLSHLFWLTNVTRLVGYGYAPICFNVLFGGCFI